MGVGFLSQGQHGGPVLGGGVFEAHDLREVRDVLAVGALGQDDGVVFRHQVADGGRWGLGHGERGLGWKILSVVVSTSAVSCRC